MAQGVTKKFVEISYNGKKIFTGDIVEGDSTDYLNSCLESSKNLQELIDVNNEEIRKLEQKVKVLQDEIKAIKGVD